MIVIRIVCDATGQSTAVDGQYIMSFNPDAHDGRGDVATCMKQGDAKQFNTTAEAHSFWRQQSKVKPLRPDGKPNCPLTAYNVELLPI